MFDRVVRALFVLRCSLQTVDRDPELGLMIFERDRWVIELRATFIDFDLHTDSIEPRDRTTRYLLIASINSIELCEDQGL